MHTPGHGRRFRAAAPSAAESARRGRGRGRGKGRGFGPVGLWAFFASLKPLRGTTSLRTLPLSFVCPHFLAGKTASSLDPRGSPRPVIPGGLRARGGARLGLGAGVRVATAMPTPRTRGEGGGPAADPGEALPRRRTRTSLRRWGCHHPHAPRPPGAVPWTRFSWNQAVPQLGQKTLTSRPEAHRPSPTTARERAAGPRGAPRGAASKRTAALSSFVSNT